MLMTSVLRSSLSLAALCGAIGVASSSLTGCCGPFGAPDVTPDDNLTVVVQVRADGDEAVAEPVCDAVVTAQALDAAGAPVGAPLTLAAQERDDVGCVYRAQSVVYDAYRIDVDHPIYGEASQSGGLTDRSDGTCVNATGLDGIDVTITLEVDAGAEGEGESAADG